MIELMMEWDATICYFLDKCHKFGLHKAALQPLKIFRLPESVFVNENGVRRHKLFSILVPEYSPYPGVSLDQALHHDLCALTNVCRVDPIGYLHVHNGQVVDVKDPGHIGWHLLLEDLVDGVTPQSLALVLYR